MKKLTVMAACAALLLGGGCFLKANNVIKMTNLGVIEALTYSSEEDILAALASDAERGDLPKKEGKLISASVIHLVRTTTGRDGGWYLQNDENTKKALESGDWQKRGSMTAFGNTCENTGPGCQERPITNSNYSLSANQE